MVEILRAHQFQRHQQSFKMHTQGQDPHRLSHQGQQPSPHHPYPQQQQPQQQQHPQQQQQDSTNASAAAAAAAAVAAAQTDQPKKAKRKRITPEQLEDLVGLFEKTDTPSFEIRENLAKKLGMTNREIQVWFQNRRAKANRIKINEQAALHHQQHLQQQQMQQHLQGHHHHPHHHRSNSANGFGGHPGHTVHSAPATPQQPIPGHHQQHSSTNGSGNNGPQESSAYGYFGPNGSSSPPMTMPTVTPRTHSSHSQRGPSNNRRPVSLYDLGSYGQHVQTQQFQQTSGAFQPQQHSSSSSSSSSSLYGPSSHTQSSGGHGHGHGHGHSHSGSFSSAFGMDIIMAKNASSATSSSQRPLLPPPINSLSNQRRTGPPGGGQSFENFDDTRRQNRHERTMSEGHPAGYMSPTSVSPISPPPERMSDNLPYRDEYRDTKEDSPSSVTHASPFANGNHTKSSSTSNNRHSTSWSSFGLKAEEMDTPVVPRERPSSAYFASTTKNRRSYDDAQYDEHQQLMRDNFNMDTRLVISEEEPRPESAIDLLAFAAAYVQESEEHKKDGKDNNDDKREMAALLNTSNKRQSFHGPSGYPSKEPYQEEPSASSTSRYSSSGMSWEASPPIGGGSGNNTSNSNINSNNPNNEVMPIPRRRGGDDGPYVSRRRPVTYGGSGFLYDHQENQFMPQSPSSSLSSYSRPSPSSNPRRLSYRSSTDTGNSQLLLQRGLTRPRRSSSTAASGILNHPPPPSSMTPVLPPILSESNNSGNNSANGNNRLLSPVMVPSPQFGSSRLARQDSSQSNGDSMNNLSVNNRESPGSDSYSRDSMNDSHASRDEEMEEIREEAEMMDESMQRAAKRRSGNFNAMFSYGVGAQ